MGRASLFSGTQALPIVVFGFGILQTYFFLDYIEKKNWCCIRQCRDETVLILLKKKIIPFSKACQNERQRWKLRKYKYFVAVN